MTEEELPDGRSDVPPKTPPKSTNNLSAGFYWLFTTSPGHMLLFTCWLMFNAAKYAFNPTPEFHADMEQAKDYWLMRLPFNDTTVNIVKEALRPKE